MTGSIQKQKTSVEFHNITELHAIMEMGSRPQDYISNKENPKETDFQIPNIAHFIWIGSVVSDKYITNIKLFSHVNPHFKVTQVELSICYIFFKEIFKEKGNTWKRYCGPGC